MNFVLKRFCNSNSQMISKKSYQSVTTPQFIISKSPRDAKLKVLKLCKSMLTNSHYFSCELYLGIPRSELHFMMKEKLRMWKDITDPREIDMLIIKAQMIEREVKKVRMTRDRAINFFKTVFKPPKKSFLESFLTKDN